MNSADDIIDTQKLLAVTGYESCGDMKNNLLKQGIVCFDGKDGPWTTLSLINMAGMQKMGISMDDKDDQEGVL